MLESSPCCRTLPPSIVIFLLGSGPVGFCFLFRKRRNVILAGGTACVPLLFVCFRCFASLNTWAVQSFPIGLLQAECNSSIHCQCICCEFHCLLLKQGLVHDRHHVPRVEAMRSDSMCPVGCPTVPTPASRNVQGSAPQHLVGLFCAPRSFS